VTGTDSIVAVYRVLQRLYPRRFRDVYGDDMVSLLRDQLQDERAWGVCVVERSWTLPSLFLFATWRYTCPRPEHPRWCSWHH
jgi:hypothetical protein